MWQRRYCTVADVSAEQLWAVIADIPNWSAWDSEIEFTQMDGSPQASSRFTLKLKHALAVKLTIEELLPTHQFVEFISNVGNYTHAGFPPLHPVSRLNINCGNCVVYRHLSFLCGKMKELTEGNCVCSFARDS